MRHRVRVEARRTLLDVIREECGCTGTHSGCEHSVCGACTVLLDATIAAAVDDALRQPGAITSLPIAPGFVHSLVTKAGGPSTPNAPPATH